MWPFGKFENRESATDAITTALVAAASSGSVPPSVEALGAVEAAAGLWSRAFSSAAVEPQTPATRVLTPSVLASIGRGLAVRGEAVFALSVKANGGIFKKCVNSQAVYPLSEQHGLEAQERR